jgi:hypothetical protein
VTIFVLSVLRLVWRWTHRPPQAVEGGFNGFLAKAVHTLLYAFMILAPLTGWAIVSTSPIKVPTMLWGVIPWPHLPLPGSVHEPFEEAHELLAWTALALIVLHVLGALRHQLLVKDGLLRRMAPGGSAVLGFLLLLLAVATFFRHRHVRRQPVPRARDGARKRRDCSGPSSARGFANTRRRSQPMPPRKTKPRPTSRARRRFGRSSRAGASDSRSAPGATPTVGASPTGAALSPLIPTIPRPPTCA